MEDLSFLDLDLDAAELAGDVTWSPPTVTWFPRFSRQLVAGCRFICPRKTCSKKQAKNPTDIVPKQDETPWKINGWFTYIHHPWKERKMLWTTKPSFWGSMLVFGGEKTPIFGSTPICTTQIVKLHEDYVPAVILLVAWGIGFWQLEESVAKSWQPTLAGSGGVGKVDIPKSWVLTKLSWKKNPQSKYAVPF